MQNALGRTAQGRAIWGDVLVVDRRDALDGQQGRPGEQDYHADDWALMQGAEGFHDLRTGQVVIFRENIRVMEGETPSQAVARVVLHERIGHHGFDVLRASDPGFARSWSTLARSIPKAELNALRSSYGHLEGNEDSLALEWFAHRIGDLESARQLEPGSVLGRMWEAVRDWMQRYFAPLSGDPSRPMSQQALDAHVRAFASRIRQNMVNQTPAAPRQSTEPPARTDGQHVPDSPKAARHASGPAWIFTLTNSPSRSRRAMN